MRGAGVVGAVAIGRAGGRAALGAAGATGGAEAVIDGGAGAGGGTTAAGGGGGGTAERTGGAVAAGAAGGAGCATGAAGFSATGDGAITGRVTGGGVTGAPTEAGGVAGAAGFAAGATTGRGGATGAGGRTGGAAAASFFCVIAFSTSPGREMCDKSILVLISSSPRNVRAVRAEGPCASAEPRMWARTFSASCSSNELEWVFFSVTPTSGSASRMALLLTSSSLARSLIRTLLIRPFFSPRCARSSLQPHGVSFLDSHAIEIFCAFHTTRLFREPSLLQADAHFRLWHLRLLPLARTLPSFPWTLPRPLPLRPLPRHLPPTQPLPPLALG